MPGLATDPPPNRLARAFALLFGAHLAGLVVPLLTVPWLARVLRPDGWAPVLVAQSLAAWAILILEFGFDLAGTRAVAQAGDPVATGMAVARVQRARLLLTPLVTALTLLAAWLLPGLEWRLVISAIVFVLARGLSPYWFFQGVQRLRIATAVETLGKVVPALAVFVLVHDPADGWKVVAAQAMGALMATTLLTIRLHTLVPVPRASNADAVHALRDALPMFGSRAASGLYIQANTLLLSLMAPAAAVAAYGGAERLVRAAINLLGPVTQGFFPHVSRLVAEDPLRARGAVRGALAGLGGLGLLAAAAAALLAPPVVRLLLGPDYAASIPVLRLLSLVIPLVAAGTVLGIYWALPLRRERLFLAIVCAGGVVNLVLAAMLVPRFQAMGMAASVVVAEVVVTGTLWLAYGRDGGVR